MQDLTPTEVAARLVPRLFLSWLLCAALYLALTQFGQITDLRRALNEDLLRHMFTAMGFVGITGFCLTLCLRGLASQKPGAMPSGTVVALTLLAASSGPALLAAATFGMSEELTIGAVLGFFGSVVTPNLVVGNIWLTRGTLSLVRTLQVTSRVFAVYAIGFYIVMFFSAAFAGLMLGPVAALFIFSAGLMWAGWLLATRTPVLLVLLVCALGALAYQGDYGVRAVRPLAERGQRPSAAEHARGWLESRRREIERERHYPVFFVTSDGGGVRSTYWTAILLGALADDDKEFARHTYVLSGVSGGSVGVALFAAQTADAAQVASRGGHRATAQAMLSQDFLAAPFAQMLTRDPFESVFCQGMGWGWACSAPPFDRVVALETVFEGAWALAVGTHRFADRVESLWEGGDSQWSVPAIILNATNAHTGDKRVVTSFSDENAFGPDQDVLARLPATQSLRLSTAALLSARFPVISPEGGVTLDGHTEHLVDGGYFDNSGGASALAVLPEFLKAVRDAKLESHIVPVAIVITNDPDRVPRSFAPADCMPPKTDDPTFKHNIGGLLTEPIGTLDSERSHASESRRKAWQSAIADAKGESIELALFRCLEDKDFEFPLGWTLSAAAREHINLKLDRLRKDAGSPYQKLLGLLRSPGS